MQSKEIYSPFKYLTTKVRRSKRDVEQEIAEILRHIIQLRGSSQQMSRAELLDRLTEGRSRMEDLQQRIKSDWEEQTEILGTCRKKIHTDASSVPSELEGGSKEESVFDSEVVHLLACRKKMEAAKNLIEYLPEGDYLKIILEMYERAFFIEESILKNQLRPLKDWCFDHSHSLCRVRSPLEFKLITCEYINILNNSREKAIEFLRKSISTMNLSEQEHCDLKKLTFMLLADPDQKYDYYSGEVEEEPIERIFEMLSDSSNTSSHHKDSKGDQLQANHNRPYQNETRNLMDQGVEVGVRLVKGSMRIKVMQQPQAVSQRLNQRVSSQKQDKKQLLNLLMNEEQGNPDYNQGHEEEQENVDEAEYEQLWEKEESEGEQEGNKREEEEKGEEGEEGEEKGEEGEGQKQRSEGKMGEEMEKRPKKIRKHMLQKNDLALYLKETRRIFLEAFQKIYRISFESSFDKILGIGISMIKTPECNQHFASSCRQAERKCPVCSKEVSKLASKVPMVLQDTSSLLCRINGSLMDEKNYPIALPSGQIYSLSGLSSTAKNGVFYCPISEQWYKKFQSSKVFLT